jgi:hypothetical protein
MRPSGLTKRSSGRPSTVVLPFLNSLKRVVAAIFFFPIGPNRATVNKPKPPQDFLSAIALRCEPPHPASLYRGDVFTALQNDHHAGNGFLEVNYGACQQAKSLA